MRALVLLTLAALLPLAIAPAQTITDRPGARPAGPATPASSFRHDLGTGTWSDGATYGQRWLMRRVAGLPGVTEARIEEEAVAVLERLKGGAQPEPENMVWMRWHEGRARSVAVGDRRRWLSVRGSENGLAAARAFVARAESAPRPQVLFEMTLLKGVEGEPTANALRLLRRGEGERVLAGSMNRSETILSSPALVTRAGEDAEISILTEKAYVKDYEISILKEEAVADPVIDTFSTGLRFAVGAVVDPDTGALEVWSAFEFSSHVEPIPTHQVRFLGRDLEVQLPTLRTSSTGSERIVLGPDHEGFVMHAPDREGGVMKIVVKVTRLPDEERPEVARVIGVDAEAGRVFATRTAGAEGAGEERPGGGVPLLRDLPLVADLFRDRRELEIVRPDGGEVVGRARVVRVAADVVILDLISGTAREGDRLR